MAQLIVRNLEDQVVRELKRRAARHGRSAEEEHREILRQALDPGRARGGLKKLLLAMPDVGDDEDFERVPDRGRQVDLLKFLLDTNVVSELRKGRRTNPGVRAWHEGVAEEDLCLSVLVVGELRKGVESIRLRDRRSAVRIERWLTDLLRSFPDRILPVTTAIAEAWGIFNVPDPLPTVDSLLAATAHVHGLTLVTRNTRDVARTGVPSLNPFR